MNGIDFVGNLEIYLNMLRKFYVIFYFYCLHYRNIMCHKTVVNFCYHDS